MKVKRVNDTFDVKKCFFSFTITMFSSRLNRYSVLVMGWLLSFRQYFVIEERSFIYLSEQQSKE